MCVGETVHGHGSDNVQGKGRVHSNWCGRVHLSVKFMALRVTLSCFVTHVGRIPPYCTVSRLNHVAIWILFRLIHKMLYHGLLDHKRSSHVTFMDEQYSTRTRTKIVRVLSITLSLFYRRSIRKSEMTTTRPTALSVRDFL